MTWGNARIGSQMSNKWLVRLIPYRPVPRVLAVGSSCRAALVVLAAALRDYPDGCMSLRSDVRHAEAVVAIENQLDSTSDQVFPLVAALTQKVQAEV
jgi:hypothetical protein